MRAGNRGQGPGIREEGFTLIELLIAIGILLAVSGVIVSLVPSVRATFERVPADIELRQRGRAALEIMTQAIRAAGRDGQLPDVTLDDPDDSGTTYSTLTAIVPVPNAAQGVLASSQASSSGPITLAISPCPNIKEVCGFTPGAAVVIVDSSGQSDVFVVAATNQGARRMTPDRALSRAYPTGSQVLEVEASTFRLDEQTDGSYSLVRVTAAGAVQPVVDFLSSLSFWFEPPRLNIALTAHPPSGAVANAVAAQVFKTSIRVRNAR